MVDIRTTLSWTAKDTDQNWSVINIDKIRKAETPDLPDLERIARNSFIHTRFYVDEHFPRELCDSLYATWIRQSLMDPAQTVFVASPAGELKGFITCVREGSQGKIGLLGIDPGSQHKGIGSSLVKAALHWFEREGISTVEVVTQGSNVAAQRLYQQAGFRTSLVQLWFHKWFTES